MKTVDAKGKRCPLPLIMTKKALGEIANDEVLEIIIDNETSVKNVTRMLDEYGLKNSVQQNGNVYTIMVAKSGSIPEAAPVEQFCQTEAGQAAYTIAFQKNKLGDGDEDLGILLMKAFVNTLPEMTAKPTHMIFLNSGVFLALNDSGVIDSLRKLEQMGTDIQICGTCLDFYQKKEALGVGRISNMYDILEVLSHSPSVLYP